MNKKDQLCLEIISLENEIEFLKELCKPIKKKKIQLNSLYMKLNSYTS
ncbi:MAG: hypothetical protein PHF86_02880 [Candidatus Nanoarchaeia archaeon]|jgi:hypothetical protein|nr:hypothetical protein [Candidatus Nanoarchaeia archaeon]